MFGLTPVDSLRRIVANQTLIKRAMLVSVLVGLFIFQIGLLEGFLPYKWQQEIYRQSERIFPSKKYEPHPDMGWEFELDYRHHPSHRIAIYGLQGVLVVGVAFLIARVWKKLRQVSC
jgi:hypothetical protein